MNKPKITPLHYSYKKPTTDVSVLNTDDIPIPKQDIHDQQIISIGPGSVGGNHQHPRIEWFIGFGNLEFMWTDENNKLHSEPMNPDGELLLFEVPPFLPHAVRNTSEQQHAVLLEFANAKMSDAQKVTVK